MKRTALKRKTPIKRLRWIVKKAPRRIARETAEEKSYKAWIHAQPCCGEAAFPSHRCADTREWNPIQQSHERDGTGLGLKADNFRSVSMCRVLHEQWKQHKINFAGWTRDQRRDWMRARIDEANERFAAEPKCGCPWLQVECPAHRSRP